MDHTYAFYAYKPDSADIFMGCLMAEYGSDSIFRYELSDFYVVELWADVMSRELLTGELGYEPPIILRGGIRIFAGDPDYDRMYSEARTRVSEIVSAREEAARKRAQEDGEKEAAKQLEWERGVFERLKTKFEPKEPR